MLRSIRFPLLFAIAAIVAASACSGGGGGDDDDDDDDDDGAAGTLDFTVNGNGFTTYTGFRAVVRVLEGTDVVGCGQSGAISGSGAWTLTLPLVLNSGATYTAEAFANLGMDLVYDSAEDGAYPLAAFTTTADFVWTVNEADTGAITWPEGTGCD